MFGQDQDPETGRNTQFKKGQSGNPKGRPKSYKFLFDEVITDDDRRAMITVLKEKALKGDIKAFEVIMDRTDGKPTQSVNMNQNQPIMPIINVAGLTGNEIDELMEREQLRDNLDDVYEQANQRQ